MRNTSKAVLGTCSIKAIATSFFKSTKEFGQMIILAKYYEEISTLILNQINIFQFLCAPLCPPVPLCFKLTQYFLQNRQTPHFSKIRYMQRNKLLVRQ